MVVLRVELVDRALERAIGVVFDIYHSAGANLRTFDEVGQCIKLFAGVFGAAFCADTDHQFGIVEQPEALAFSHVIQLNKLHTESNIRLVAAIETHCIVPRHTRELVEFQALHLLEKMFGQTFKSLQNILLLYKRHFAVDLREFRLTVGAQVLVAEATNNLKVAVHTCHHQQLFVLLRALRQSIELAGIHTRGHYEIACTFGCRLDKERSLYFKEVEVIQVVAHQDRHTVTQLEVAAHRIAAQVQIAVFHTKVVAAIALVLDGKRRSLCSVEHIQLLDIDLNLASRNLGVLRCTLNDNALYLKHIFASQLAGLLAKFGIGFHIESQLRDTVTVAQIYKSHTSKVTAALQPAAQRHFLTDIADI